MLQQRFGGLALLRIQRHADADADLERHVVDRERLAEGFDDPLGDAAGGWHVGRAGQQDGELVAAQTRHRVRLAQRLAQARADQLEQAVPDQVAERVVDFLEAVEIEQQHRHRLVRTPRRVDRLRDAVVEQGPVRQAGQGVVQGHALQLGMLRLALRDVAQHRDADPARVDLHAAQRDVDRNAAAVVAQRHELARAAVLRPRGERPMMLVRQQPGHGLADQLGRRPPEHALGGAVAGEHGTTRLEGHDRIEAAVDQLAGHPVVDRQRGRLPARPPRPALRLAQHRAGERQHQPEPGGGGVEHDRRPRLQQHRKADQGRDRPGEQREPARPGEAHEQRPEQHHEQRAAERDRPAADMAERPVLAQGLEGERLDDRSRQGPVTRHAEPVAELDRGGADQHPLAGDQRRDRSGRSRDR